MNFSTPVKLPSDLPRFTQADELLLMGSCFATNIGALLADARFRPDVNPFGVLYIMLCLFNNAPDNPKKDGYTAQ